MIANHHISRGSLEINPYNSWIALNKWPIRLPDRPEESTPMWSGRIKIFDLDVNTPTWNVLLLSMKFGIFEPISKTWSDIPGGEIVFDGGLVTILDPGTGETLMSCFMEFAHEVMPQVALYPGSRPRLCAASEPHFSVVRKIWLSIGGLEISPTYCPTLDLDSQTSNLNLTT